MSSREGAQIRIGPQGRLVIPAEFRRALHLETGEILVARVEHERLILERRTTILNRLQQRFADHVPVGTSLADELVQSRREEARHESETV